MGTVGFDGADVVGGGTDASEFFFRTTALEARGEKISIGGEEGWGPLSGGFDGGVVAAVVHGGNFTFFVAGVIV